MGVPLRPPGCPGVGVTGSREPPDECANVLGTELKFSEEQEVFFATEPSLQPLDLTVETRSHTAQADVELTM